MAAASVAAAVATAAVVRLISLFELLPARPAVILALGAAPAALARQLAGRDALILLGLRPVVRAPTARATAPTVAVGHVVVAVDTGLARPFWPVRRVRNTVVVDNAAPPSPLEVRRLALAELYIDSLLRPPRPAPIMVGQIYSPPFFLLSFTQ